MSDSNQTAGRLLAMLHNMPRERDGTLRLPPNDKDYVGLGLTTAEFVGARDALIGAKQITVNGDRWKILDLKAVPQGYTHGFDGIPPTDIPEALPRSIEQVAAGTGPDKRSDVPLGGFGYSGPAKPVPVQAEPATQEIPLAKSGVPDECSVTRLSQPRPTSPTSAPPAPVRPACPRSRKRALP